MITVTNSKGKKVEIEERVFTEMLECIANDVTDGENWDQCDVDPSVIDEKRIELAELL